MDFYRMTNSSIHATLSHSLKAAFLQHGCLIPTTSRACYKTPSRSDNSACISNGLLPLLCTFYCCATILPQPPPRHPLPRQLRLFAAENCPFSTFAAVVNSPVAGWTHLCNTTLLDCNKQPGLPRFICLYSSGITVFCLYFLLCTFYFSLFR